MNTSLLKVPIMARFFTMFGIVKNTDVGVFFRRMTLEIKHHVTYALKVAVSLAILSFLPSVIYAEPGDFDLSIYGGLSWDDVVMDNEGNRIPDYGDFGIPQNNFQYPESNFWVHDYDGNTIYTHAGIDYSVDPIQHNNVEVEHGKVMGYGYGQVEGVNGSHTVSVKHLLNSGDTVRFNLMHMNPVYVTIDENFLSKYQFLGRESNYACDGCGAHLHLEVSETGPNNEWVFSNSAHPGDGVARDNVDNLDDLIPHYGGSSRGGNSAIYFNPTEVGRKRELLPYLSWQQNPTSGSYSVFGYANKPLYGSLSLNRENEADFHQVGIIAQTAGTTNRNTNRSQLGDIGENEGRWLAENNDLTVGTNTEVSGDYGEYRDAFYAFSASVQQEENGSSTSGYPVLFNVLKENSLIVDNDQLEQQPGQDREQTEFSAQSKYYSTVPGYLLSAGIVKGNSGKVTQWKPIRRGVFQILVHIPRIPNNPTPAATSVRYKIVTRQDDGTTTIDVTNPINHSQAGWQTLIVGSGENKQEHFFLNSTDYVSLDLNTAYDEAHWGNVGRDNTNINIAANQFVAIDAIKFKGGLREDSDGDSDLTKIRNGLSVTEEVAAAVYRNYMTEAPNSIDTGQADETISVEHDSSNDLSRYTLNDSVITISWVDGSVEGDNIDNTDNANKDDGNADSGGEPVDDSNDNAGDGNTDTGSEPVDDSNDNAGGDSDSGNTDTDTGTDDSSNTTNDNPSYEEIRTEILSLAKEHNIPPVIIQAIVFKESTWAHFDDNGDAKIHQEPDGREGIGIMQVTECPPEPKPEPNETSCANSISQAVYDQLKDDWKHNLAVGVERLDSKWDKQNSEVYNALDTAIDKGILENWYYPVMWYNGKGPNAENYVGDAFSRMEEPPVRLKDYWDTLTNVSDPTEVVVMRKADGTGGEGYELTDLIDEGVTLHYWDSETEEYLYLTTLSEEEYADRETTWPPSHAQVEDNDDGTTKPVDPSPSIMVNTVNKDNGDIQIAGTGLGNAGIVKVNGQEVQGQWTDEGISLNTGIALNNLEQPVRIQVVDNNGNEVVNICYPFVDVCPGSWYARPVTTLWKKGLVNGYGGEWKGYFRPHKPPANRAEFVAVAVRAKELGNTPEPLTTSPFTDVSIDDWYAPYVQYAKDMGIIEGCETDKFCPNKAISRPAAVKVVVAAFLNET
ncbi:MAG: hypothetical protein DRR19_21455, partial [Candidatus Parabeggiatoa sp. nov. 1]